MIISKSKVSKGLIIASLVAALAGCSAKEAAPAPKEADVTAQATQTVNKVTDLNWDIQPKSGIIKGDYYKIEERFRQGHLGTLEVVKNEDKIVHVEFNELTRPNYYLRYYQNVPKRMSEYNFTMGEKKGAAWVQSVVQVEKQMVEEQRITGEFDVVSGASNSINQSMVPLAEKLQPSLSKPSEEKYYSIAEKFEGGLTGVLKVVLRDKKIVSVRYDEIFANSPDEIADENLKKFYRQSKYESVEYEEPSRIGFNVQMDALNAKVVETQNMLDLTGLPAIENTGDYGKSGYTERNTAWDNYLNLAEKLLEEMKKDGNF
ncbi:MAG: FMN-binding domain protein [Clostridia bacterium]|jgi:major membrane immunogen (membrane-anchored lipoprotein)|nr:FMN-binding domain protein [Clostridia bacterium]